MIEADIAEIENHIFHLLRSNTALIEELKTDPDEEYRLAIEENLQVVMKKKAKLQVSFVL